MVFILLFSNILRQRKGARRTNGLNSDKYFPFIPPEKTKPEVSSVFWGCVRETSVLFVLILKIIRFQNSSTYLEYSVEWPALNFWKNTRKTSVKGLFKRTYDCHPEKVTFYNVVQGKYYLKYNFRAVTFLTKVFYIYNMFPVTMDSRQS